MQTHRTDQAAIDAIIDLKKRLLAYFAWRLKQ
jgi:hypothetical protein